MSFQDVTLISIMCTFLSLFLSGHVGMCQIIIESMRVLVLDLIHARVCMATL